VTVESYSYEYKFFQLKLQSKLMIFQ